MNQHRDRCRISADRTRPRSPRESRWPNASLRYGYRSGVSAGRNNELVVLRRSVRKASFVLFAAWRYKHHMESMTMGPLTRIGAGILRTLVVGQRPFRGVALRALVNDFDYSVEGLPAAHLISTGWRRYERRLGATSRNARSSGMIDLAIRSSRSGASDFWMRRRFCVSGPLDALLCRP